MVNTVKSLFVIKKLYQTPQNLLYSSKQWAMLHVSSCFFFFAFGNAIMFFLMIDIMYYFEDKSVY